jgi:long-chain fatty acid transport protein
MLSAAFQSRIDMGELATLRGVHGYSADLDIPSRMKMGLDLRASDRTVFTMAVSQVFYSQVGAFPSRSLPARFNALLGDSTSPDFEWNDLTVYSFGLRWQHESDLEFRVDYHTRSQPTPTAPTLASALADELAQQSILVGVGKSLGDHARLDLSATYAPPEFAFGGNVLGVVSDRLDQAVEVSARLNFSF